ncbi:MAG: Carboxyl-terminal protease [Candidatus Nomurabacteria bacterium GW2011_GWE1_32_28]|uniref:Carboxyl-terminal protease n=1 Tax=Candidatus Nomurabacteria bacterium GW2011_GWF1_31_48 TaxID=1618767 RepID=A0A0F9YFS3_9BACT|nr:MAG: Carboxyl-terminal protease [Candidatus Nomurabacteria bacterium GW2011_GWF2_30_133]KKP29016.1 MAG: Carboxyl-terminal protease [Candidatus Nomurabacteria bacterium GW2011_GWE2_31_40]KKP30574.1 MAG: Carboxyl-terminal protease [Candidatus Nomurabacteria bacterium GW2011_GWF1_31_48]KKP35059.1 MAG: Carboxyl-terminal protease [Candidatus Nomurabacteria bacterium GW2011_GWE1_32_28]HAS80577.1 S41 family peptidase [Candidatus Nomurabacteria bacterium]
MNKFIEYIKVRRARATVLLVVIFFGLGIYIGFIQRPEINKVVNILNKETAASTETDFSPFWKVWNDINEKYPNVSNTSDQDKLYGAISGLVGSLNDPYSTFFNPEEAKLFEDDIQGNFSGVGMEIGIKDKILTVIAPLKDTPAYKANIKSGDQILKINDTLTSNLSIDKAIKLIRGDVGTVVTLTIFREGDEEPKEINVTRGVINIPTLDTELRKDGIFVIKLYSFSANSAELFREALKEFSLTKTDKLLLDLRGNPGGYLDAAVSMASWFLDSGKVVVTEDYGDNLKPKIYRSQGYDIFSDKLKFGILIDGGSASASEILAGAMQDYKKAFLVGGTSYGKGSVQELLKVTPNTMLKITVAKWLTPKGNSISEKGLTPDYEILFTKKDIEQKNDVQLNKAIELLLK